MTTVNVKGLSELQTFLNQLPAKMEANVIRGALRAGMKPVKELAIQGCPTGEPSETNKRRYRLYNGALRDSIRISSKTDKRSGKIVSRLVAGGKSKKSGADVFYANMIEYGTKPHSGGNPGVIQRPFMRPALDNGANTAVVAAGEYIKKRLATKHGLDTTDVNIEVDE